MNLKSFIFFRKIILTSTCILLFVAAKAQNKEYAQEIIKTLCSPSYHGRGYVAKGDKKAAKYIAAELKKHQLKMFASSYFQPLSFPVNTFPSKVEITYNGDDLIGGVDYLIDASSPSLKKEFHLIWVDSVFFIDDAKKQERFNRLSDNSYMPVFDMSAASSAKQKSKNDELIPILKQKGKPLILIVDKLTYGAATSVANSTVIQIKKDQLAKEDTYITVNIKNKYYSTYQSNNVAAYVQGETDSMIVLTAHYDHLGRMGKNVYFPGAHDNASGVSLLLDLAQHLSANASKPHYSIAFLFFTGEEAGLIGSFYFANNPLFDLKKVRFLLNLDLMGSGEDGIQVVNASIFKEDFNLLTSINDNEKYLKTIKPRGAAANSDHYPFYDKGVPCFFAYTLGAYKEYHNINDTAENVPLNAYNELFKLFNDFIFKL